MKSSYDTLGNYIRIVDERNRDLSITRLLGVSIGKKFISSIANTVGTDFRGYKIVRTRQFAYGPVTSRNGEKISVALLNDDDCIISSSYTVFEVTDSEKLLPEYLMLWFMRPEFDRYARYKSHGSVREIFSWDEMCAVELPVPDIEKQREIVKAYRTITDRIALKQRINENLEQTAQAIYHSMFVTEQHDSDRIGVLSELITVKYGKDHKNLNDGIYPVYGSGGIMRYVEKPLYDKESVLIPRKGSLNNVMYVNKPFWSVDTMFYTEMKQPNIAKFVFHFIKSKDLASLNTGSAVPSMTTDILNSMELRIPSANRLVKFESLVASLYRTIDDNIHQFTCLSSLRDVLLSNLL